MEGEKFWVHFKYERLLTFCFLCGKMGHDNKHCQAFPDRQKAMTQYRNWLKAYGIPKGGNSKPRNFSNSSHNIGGEDKVSEKGQKFENMLQSAPVSHGGGSTSSGSIQNSKNSKASNKSDQVWGCDMSGTPTCQAMEGRIRWYRLEVEQALWQNEGPHDGWFAPSPMEELEPGVREIVSDALSKMGRSAQETENSPEVTSPQKPKKSAQAYEVSTEQKTGQGIMKIQNGKGRIKKLAR